MNQILLSVLLLLSNLARAQFSDIIHPAPDFSSDAEWLDQGAHVPHHIKGYHGHVLLIDFWEYTCINCIRDFAVVKRWYAKYHSYGFDVVAVHYGEFAMGHSSDNVAQAAKHFRLPWPVVSDVHGTIWKAYDSDGWPNRYLVDQDGKIVLQVKGEGNNRPMEEKIRELLAKQNPAVTKIPVEPEENSFSPQCGIPTQETYVGDWYGRGSLENKQGGSQGAGDVIDFHADHSPRDGGVVLSGKWRTGQDGVISAADKARAELSYHARSLYAVLSLEDTKKPFRVDVTQDGHPLDKSDAGLDVSFDGKGSYVEVGEPRMYFLIKNPEFGSHILALSANGRGLHLHSFTFGNNCQQDFERAVVFNERR